MFRVLAGTYTTTISGIRSEVGTGDLTRSIHFGDDPRALTAVGYGFADQTMIADAHDALSTVNSYLTLNPAPAAWLVSQMAGTVGGRFVADHARRFAQLASHGPSIGSPGTRLAIEGFDRHSMRTERLHLVSEHDQAELTAIIVAATTGLLSEQHRTGRLDINELLDLPTAAKVIARRAPRTRLIT